MRGIFKLGAEKVGQISSNCHWVKVPNEKLDQKMISAIFSKPQTVSDAGIPKSSLRPPVDVSLEKSKSYLKTLRTWLDKNIVKPFKYMKHRNFKSTTRTEGPTEISVNKIYIESEGAKEILQETEKIYAHRYC